MKGVVFTEFLAFVEDTHGLATVDEILNNCKTETGGAYTAVGTYNASELFQMVAELSRLKSTHPTELVKAFGAHLFRYFTDSHAASLAYVHSTEQLLASVDQRIHVEVRKLFPDAELPSIQFRRLDDQTSEVIYRSTRPLADLAEGLILEAIAHYRDPIRCERNDLPPSDGTHARFLLMRQAAV
jgi:hypothetical protein